MANDQNSGSLVATALRNLPQYIQKSSLVGPDKHAALACVEVLRQALEAPAPAMLNGVEGLSPIYGQVPTVEEARTAIGTALDDAAKALRVLSTMLKKEKLMQGYAVADEILGRLGYATKLNAALAQQPQGGCK